MSDFFQFERDFANSLRCIPMQVRYKLDICGIKLKLPQWNQFSHSDRQMLLDLPCQTPQQVQTYRETLQKLVEQVTGEKATDLPVEDNPDWENDLKIPDSVDKKAQEVGIPFSLAKWTKLEPIQRFVLIKLSRSSHENRNFVPALKEFHLV
ncbi:MAG: nitrate reductase associated protein [Pleurocapsa sp.]